MPKVVLIDHFLKFVYGKAPSLFCFNLLHFPYCFQEMEAQLLLKRVAEVQIGAAKVRKRKRKKFPQSRDSPPVTSWQETVIVIILGITLYWTVFVGQCSHFGTSFVFREIINSFHRHRARTQTSPYLYIKSLTKKVGLTCTMYFPF